MFYPAYLNLQDRKCLVVGGGTVAERKAVSLLLSGGAVTTVSPEATELLVHLAKIRQISWHKRQFQAGDTTGMFLVCGATEFSKINSFVFKDAHETNGIPLVNIVDVIPECTFAAASVVACEGLSVSISTSGKSPAMARRIREHLESRFGTTSLYSLGYEDGQPVAVPNRQLPYPVNLLLEKRICVVTSTAEQISSQMERRVTLLQQCGASIVYMSSTQMDSHTLSNAFLVLIESESDENLYRGHRSQLVECLGALKAGTFVTPELVMDGDLIISISRQDDQVANEDELQRVQRKIADQFENRGYGKFIGFLGSLRPHVLEAISIQRERQSFFETLIDCIPRFHAGTIVDEIPKCCLGFENPDCSNHCVFNLVRQGKIESAHRYALEQIKKKACSA